MPGTQSLEGLVFLSALALALRASTIFEIGTYNGLSTWCLAENAPDQAAVHTLDLSPEEAPQLRIETRDEDTRRRFARRIFDVLPPSARVIDHWGDSATFDFTPFYGRCQLVYVDGAHSEQYVRSDTEHALRMLALDGAVVWDDYVREVEGVRPVLDSRSDLWRRRVPGTRLVLHLTPAARERLQATTDEPSDAFTLGNSS